MKKCVLFIKFILIIILVLVIGWYLFGEFGPLEGMLVLKQQSDSGEVAAEQSEQIPEPIEETEAEPAEEIDRTTKIVFTGDVELSEYVQAKYDASGINGVLSESLLDTLQTADILMINNEFCFSTRGEAADKQFTFRVDPGYTAILNDMGVDVAGLANNHVLDFGKDALLDTFDTLTNAGIEYTGAGTSLDDAAKLVIKTDEAGRTYGFLAASHVIPVYSWDIQSSSPGEFTFYNETELINRVEEYSKQVDYLFVMVHWGVERTTDLENYQVVCGHKIIDAGASAVIGMHSHCLQPIEFYEGHPIFYSLGNFIFNASIKDGGAVEVTIDENDNMSFRFIPVSAADTKTSENYSLIQYVQDMSETVGIDGEGNIVSR